MGRQKQQGRISNGSPRQRRRHRPRCQRTPNFRKRQVPHPFPRAIANTSTESWVTVPTNSTLTIHKQTVMVHPIIDDYYNCNPYHRRSSKFVQDKGLITNEKQPNGASTSPGVMPGLALPAAKKPLSPISRDIASTLVPVPARAKTPVSNGSLASDLRKLTVVQNQTREAKPQEMGNTKKKRALTREDVQEQQQEVESPAQTAFGNPLKIAQYFPELN
jgi:glutamine amidotransferase